MTTGQPSHAPPPGDNRRSFFAIAAAVVTGAVAVLTPLAAGVASFLTPLFRKSKSSTVRIALLEQIPDDGVPRSFPVLADRVDAWTRYPQQRIGAVYLVRNKGEAAPTAFTAKCPHAGCFIGYTPGEETFKCPCHTSAFKLDGTRARGDNEVSPRDMDELEVELVTIDPKAPIGNRIRGRRRMRRRGHPGAPGNEHRNAPEPPPGTHIEVWVEYVDFQTGHKEQIATT